MTYGYTIRLAVDRYHDFRTAYRKSIVKRYRKLKRKDKIYFEFGVEERGGAYSDEMVEQLRRLLKPYPDFVFSVYYSWWECTNLNIIEIQNGVILNTQSFDYEDPINITPKCRYYVRLTPDEMMIQNEITDWFGDAKIGFDLWLSDTDNIVGYVSDN